METPILMTDDQKRAFLKTKTEAFLIGLKKLEEDTGMTLDCNLSFSPQGISPRIQIMPRNEEQKKPTTN